MFENDEDIDVDDEFLNIVFDDEISGNNQKPSVGLTDLLRRPTENLVESNTQSASRKCTVSVRDQSETYNSCLSRHVNHNQQGSSESFVADWNRTIAGHSSVKGDQGLESASHGNKENKRRASPPPSRSKRERRFPGPAGLLPDRKSLRGTPLKDSLLDVESPSASNSGEDLCSQGQLSGSVLEEGPWQSLLSDLGPHVGILDTVNVASVKRKAAARCFVGRKLPFLAAALHHLDVSSADPCVILRDTTGEIHGTLHRSVWQQFAAQLVVGSVLVVRNVGLLSTGLSSRRHYLNITANNLVTIYSANQEKLQKRELYSFTPQDYERTIEQWKSLVVPPRNTGSPSSSLFNTSVSSLGNSPAHSPLTHNIQPRFNSPINPAIRPSTFQNAINANIRPSSSQNAQGCGNFTGVPQNPRANPLPRPTGKILFPPGSNSIDPKPVQRFSSNTVPPNAIRPNYSVSKPNSDAPNVSRNNFNNSFQSQSVQTPNVRNIQNGQLKVPAPSFKFDPVVLKNKTNGAVCLPNNFDNLSSPRNDFGKHHGSSPQVVNSPKIILSQSSQLTVEEQSVVESVFDGIDADSLFDDDF